MPDCDEDDVYACLEEDWTTDVGNTGSMFYAEFEASMLQLADLWYHTYHPTRVRPLKFSILIQMNSSN